MFHTMPAATDTASRNRRAGFAILEVIALVVVGFVVLFLLCLFLSPRGQLGRYTSTRAFMMLLESGLALYARDFTTYPPDSGPPGSQALLISGGEPPPTAPMSALAPEALFHYLANPFLSANHPYVALRRHDQTADLNRNGLPEIVDVWGRPLLYNRPHFPSGDFDNGTDPFHNKNSFDLYSVGPDGQTGTSPLPDPKTDLRGFCEKAMDEPADGNGPDDIRNW